MKQIKTLNKVYNDKLNVMDAYDVLFKRNNKIRHYPKSHLVRVEVFIIEHPYLSMFLSLLTMLPLPTSVLRYFLRKINTTEENYSVKDLIEISSYKHIKMEVTTPHVYIKIKTI